MSWYIRGFDYQQGFDSSFFEPQTISAGASNEIPQGYQHYLFWNTNEAATGERVTSTEIGRAHV